MFSDRTMVECLKIVLRLRKPPCWDPASVNEVLLLTTVMLHGNILGPGELILRFTSDRVNTDQPTFSI